MEREVRRALLFQGKVQGVGFRYTAQHAAERCGATGWVKNNYDGSVSLEIQGTDAVFDRFLGMLLNNPFIRIDNMEVETIPLSDEDDGFVIR